jgi:putative transposon-encoded protein
MKGWTTSAIPKEFDMYNKTSVKVIGSNGQISLGKEFAGRQVLVEERESGVWQIRTALVVPENETWLHQPHMRESLQKAIDDAQSREPSETKDFSAFLEDLENGSKKGKA